MIGSSDRTLRRWKQKDREGDRLASPLGREPLRSSRNRRVALLASFSDLGPERGVVVYQGLHPNMPRREIETMVLRFREVRRRREPKLTHRLEWLQPGRVWATDHSHIPSARRSRIAISCRDLASHQQLLWKHGRETAEITIQQLRSLFEEHGAPLVIKADGGPTFRSDAFDLLLDQYGVELLPSPPYHPEYNGSCEAANHSMKTRTQHVAEWNGRPDAWEAWDLELARLQANHTTRPWGVHGSVPLECWLDRSLVPDTERRRFRETCQRLRSAVVAENELFPGDLRKECTARWVQRVAVSRALVEHGLLIIKRRVIRPPIKTIRSA